MKSRLYARLMCNNLFNPQNNPSKFRDCCSIFRKRAKDLERLHNMPRAAQPECEPSRIWLLCPRPLPIFTVLSRHEIGEELANLNKPCTGSSPSCAWPVAIPFMSTFSCTHQESFQRIFSSDSTT